MADASRPCIEVLDPIVAEILRRKTPAERLQIAYDMNEFARHRIRGHLRGLHPDWSPDEIERELVRRLLGTIIHTSEFSSNAD